MLALGGEYGGEGPRKLILRLVSAVRVSSRRWEGVEGVAES